MGLGQRLMEIRYPKTPPSTEKLITKDTYKKFDTTGLVEMVVELVTYAKQRVADILKEVVLLIRATNLIHCPKHRGGRPKNAHHGGE